MLVTGFVINRLRGQDLDDALRNAALGAVVGNATAGIANPIARAVVGTELRGAITGKAVTDEDRRRAVVRGAVGGAVSEVVSDPLARSLVVDTLVRSTTGGRTTAAAQPAAAIVSSASVDAAISSLHATSSPSGSRAAGAYLGQVASGADDAAKTRALTALSIAASSSWQAASVSSFPDAVLAIAREASPEVRAHARAVLVGWASSWNSAGNRASVASVLGQLGG